MPSKAKLAKTNNPIVLMSLLTLQLTLKIYQYSQLIIVCYSGQTDASRYRKGQLTTDYDFHYQ